MKPQDSLKQRIDDLQPLTAEEQSAILEIFGKRCRQETKNRLARVLARVPMIDNHGIYGRVMLQTGGEGAFYCAGQDYRSEVPFVRNLLLGRK